MAKKSNKFQFGGFIVRTSPSKSKEREEITLSKNDLDNIRSILSEPNKSIQKFKSATNFNSILKNSKTSDDSNIDERFRNTIYLSIFLWQMFYEAPHYKSKHPKNERETYYAPMRCYNYILEKMENWDWKILFMSIIVGKIDTSGTGLDYKIISNMISYFGLNAIFHINKYQLFETHHDDVDDTDYGTEIKINLDTYSFSKDHLSAVYRDTAIALSFIKTSSNQDLLLQFNQDSAINFAKIAFQLNPTFAVNAILGLVYANVRSINNTLLYLEDEVKLREKLHTVDPSIAMLWEVYILKAVEIDPGKKDVELLSKALTILNEELGKEENKSDFAMRFDRANVNQYLGDYKKSLIDCDLILKGERNPETFLLKARVQFNLARNEKNRKLMKEALSSINESIKLLKDEDKIAQALYIRADIYRELGQPEKAYFDKQKLDEFGYDVSEYEEIFTEMAEKVKKLNKKLSEKDQNEKILSENKILTRTEFEKIINENYLDLIKNIHPTPKLKTKRNWQDWIYQKDPHLGLLFINIIFIKRVCDSSSNAWGGIVKSKNPIKTLIGYYKTLEKNSDQFSELLFSEMIPKTKTILKENEKSLNQLIHSLDEYKWSEDLLNKDNFNLVFITHANLHFKKINNYYQYTTGNALTLLIIRIMDLNKSSIVYDPACGTAGIFSMMAGLYHPPKKMIGQDIDPIALAYTRMKLYLHEVKDYIIQKNSLESEPLTNNADCAILDAPIDNLNLNKSFDHILKSLNKNGQAIIIIPTKDLNNENQFKKIVDEEYLDLVLTLPKHFGDHRKYTKDISLSILMFSKKEDKSSKKVRFIDAENRLLRMTKNYQQEFGSIIDIVDNKITFPLDFNIDYKIIKENDYVLRPNSYFNQVNIEKKLNDLIDVSVFGEGHQKEIAVNEVAKDLTHELRTIMSNINNAYQVIRNFLLEDEKIDKSWLVLPEYADGRITLKDQIIITDEKFSQAFRLIENLKELHAVNKDDLKKEKCDLPEFIESYFKQIHQGPVDIIISESSLEYVVNVDKQCITTILDTIAENIKNNNEERTHKEITANFIFSHIEEERGSFIEINYTNDGEPLDNSLDPSTFFTIKKLPGKPGRGHGRQMIKSRLELHGGYVEMSEDPYLVFGFAMYLPTKKQR